MSRGEKWFEFRGCRHCAVDGRWRRAPGVILGGPGRVSSFRERSRECGAIEVGRLTVGGTRVYRSELFCLLQEVPLLRRSGPPSAPSSLSAASVGTLKEPVLIIGPPQRLPRIDITQKQLDLLSSLIIVLTLRHSVYPGESIGVLSVKFRP